MLSQVHMHDCTLLCIWSSCNANWRCWALGWALLLHAAAQFLSLLLLYTAMTSCHLSCLHCESFCRSNKRSMWSPFSVVVVLCHTEVSQGNKRIQSALRTFSVSSLSSSPKTFLFSHSIRNITSHHIHTTRLLKSDTMITTTHTPTSMHPTNSTSSCLPLHQDTNIAHSCAGRGEENKPWFEESKEGWYYPLQRQQQQQQPWIWLDDQQDDEIQSRGCHSSRSTLVCADPATFGYVHPHGVWVLAWIERYVVQLSTETVDCHCQYQCSSEKSTWSIRFRWSSTTSHVYTQCRRSMSSERSVVCGADGSVVWCAAFVDRDGNRICHFGTHHWLCMPYSRCSTKDIGRLGDKSHGLWTTIYNSGCVATGDKKDAWCCVFKCFCRWLYIRTSNPTHLGKQWCRCCYRQTRLRQTSNPPEE